MATKIVTNYAPVSGKVKASTTAAGTTSSVVAVVMYLLDQNIGWIGSMNTDAKGALAAVLLGAANVVTTFAAGWFARHEPTVEDLVEKAREIAAAARDASGLTDTQIHAIWNELADPVVNRLESAAAMVVTHANAALQSAGQAQLPPASASADQTAPPVQAVTPPPAAVSAPVPDQPAPPASADPAEDTAVDDVPEWLQQAAQDTA